MTPENNQPESQPTQPELITGMPANLESAPAPEEMLEAGEQEPLLESGEQPKVIDSTDVPMGESPATEAASEAPKVIDSADVPAGEPEADTQPIPAVDTPSAPMNEYGGYTNINSPTPEQAEENLRQVQEAAGPSTEAEGDVNPVRPYVQQ